MEQIIVQKAWFEGLLKKAEALEKSKHGIGVSEYYALLGFIDSAKDFIK